MGTISDYSSGATAQRSRRSTGLSSNLGAKPIAPTTAAKSNKGILGEFGEKVGAVASQTGRLATSVGKAAVGFVGNTAVDIVRDARGTASTFAQGQTIRQKVATFERLSESLNNRQQSVIDSFKAGQISKEDYNQQLKDLAAMRKELNDKIRPDLDGKGAAERIEEIAMTTANALSLGSLGLSAAGGKQALQAGSREAVEALVSQSATRLEAAATRLPVVRSLIVRNLSNEAKKEASKNMTEFLARNAKDVAFGLLVKRPLFYQANLEDARKALDAREILTGIIEGKPNEALVSSAWLGIQLLDGGPLGAMGRGYKFLSGKVGELAYGNGSLIDEVSRRIGNKSANQLAELVQSTKGTKAGKEVEEALRILQHTNSKVYGKNVQRAADDLVATFVDPDTMTAETLVKSLINHRNADIIGQREIQKLVTAGTMTAEEAARFTPVRWTQQTRDALAKRVGAEMDIQKQLEILNKYGDKYGFNNNDSLMAQLEAAVNRNAGGSGDLASAIREIDAASVANKAKGITRSAEKKLAKLGYIYAKPAGGRNVGFVDDANTLPRLISDSADGTIDLFDQAVAPQPAIQSIKNILQRSGLSPEAASRTGQVKLTEAVAQRLKGTSFSQSFSYSKDKDLLYGSKAVLTKLQDYVEHMKPNKLGRFATAGAADKAAVTDLRQLTKGEIIEALSSKGSRLTKAQAGEVQDAVIKGYLDVPMELRGVGPRVVDYLYRINPVQGAYSRVQSALRYTYNPFFRVQESVETSVLSGMQGGNRFKNIVAHNGLWKKSRGELDDVVQQLDDAKIFSSSLYGEAAQDQVLGRITANLTQGQKRDLAGLAIDLAKRQNTDVATMLKESPDLVDDALRVIVQYPREGILASPLARTLNVAFFPMRYNAKVTTLAAQTLAKQPPVIQKAALHGLLEASDWLKSDEGIEWQAEYADALGVFKWLTPIGSIESALSLLRGSVDAPSDLGLLGGLPLGVITQMLDSQGIIDLNTPYVNPKTGDVIPKYIPESAKARAATALTDLLGSTFTYPGRTLGLPGKGENLRKAVKLFIDNGYDDFNVESEEENLTELQRNMIRVLKGDTSEEAINAVYNSALPDQYNGFTLPPNNYEDLFTQPRRTGLPSKAKKGSSKRAKNFAQPIQRSQ